jgi:16S rRNA (cytosine1402-N4)-methyltransferase
MRHETVLLNEVIENLKINDGGVFVDLTLGSAGHSQAVSKLNIKNLTIVGIDKDSNAIKRSQNYLETSNAKLILETASNTEIDKVLKKYEIEKVDSILLDLGISSEQLEVSGRGFTFLKEEPLLMTMKDKLTPNDLTAQIVVNSFSEESLADIIYGFGEEKYARRIAKGIIEARKTKEIKTTFELVEIIKKSTPISYHHKKIHPATKTFQALRMTVNDEYSGLTVTLNKSFDYLKKNGRLLVISFHSIEDRIVKRFMNEKHKDNQAKKINKKPIIPTISEISKNPRSRSAKLRILEKTI